ncbi:MAG: Crp/Fnr family transcriptional regulator [Thermoleophilia bacterium]
MTSLEPGDLLAHREGGQHPQCVCDRIAGHEGRLHPACLADLWIFDNLSPREIEAILNLAWREKREAGSSIFTQGQQADRMFLIKAGRVKLSRATEDGTELILDIRKAGDFVGETMLGEDSTYPVSAWCLEDTLVCGFTQERFHRLVTDHPNIAYQVIRNLSNRVSSLSSRVGSMSATRLEDRIYGVLATVAKEHGSPVSGGRAIHFPLTHEELSFLVGAHRVSVTRAMKSLRESGKIVDEGRRLIVCETEAR